MNAPMNISPLESDKLYFVSFCIEQYKKHIAATGDAVLELFDKYGITDYLYEYYDVLHTQGVKWLLEEIDNLIAERKKDR